MNLDRLLKQNVEQCEDVLYAPSKRMTEEDGSPIYWILRPLTSKEYDAILEKHTKRKMNGKRKGGSSIEIDMIAVQDDMVLASLVEPSVKDLENKELQDSWGVFTPIDLLKAMLSVAGEMADLREEVQAISGFDIEATNDLADEFKKN